MSVNIDAKYINWEKESISKVYDEKTKKLTFLVQFKKHISEVEKYKYSFKVVTSERQRTCDGNFISTANALYFICSVKIDNKEALEERITTHLVVEKWENHETQIEVHKNYNTFKNISSLDWTVSAKEWERNSTTAEIIDHINIGVRVYLTELFKRLFYNK